MWKSPIPDEEPGHDQSEAKPAIGRVNEVFAKSPGGLREIVRTVMQEMLEAEMTDALGAEKGESARPLGSAIAPAITAELSSPGLASSSCACRRIGTDNSPPNSSSVTGAPSRRWWRPWPRCTCKASRPGRSRQSPRSSAALPSRPSPPSTSAWTKASRPLPCAPLPSPLPTSSSTLAMRRCARAASS